MNVNMDTVMKSDETTYRSTRTLEELIDQAALECTEERERYLAIFTIGVEGYVCRNESSTDESRALFKGHYRDCQVWIERKGLAAALHYLVEHSNEVPELGGRELTARETLAYLARRFE